MVDEDKDDYSLPFFCLCCVHKLDMMVSCVMSRACATLSIFDW